MYTIVSSLVWPTFPPHLYCSIVFVVHTAINWIVIRCNLYTQVVIEGIIGPGWASDASIDDVTFASGLCPEEDDGKWIICIVWHCYPFHSRVEYNYSRLYIQLCFYCIRAVYTRENTPRITHSAAYVSRELSHLYGHSLSKELVRGLRKPRTSFSCRLYEQFAAYVSHGLCNPRLISPRINGPIVNPFTPKPEILHLTILTTSLVRFSLKDWENVLFEPDIVPMAVVVSLFKNLFPAQ